MAPALPADEALRVREASASLPAALPGIDWIVDGLRVARLSQDFSWFSPVLKQRLEGRHADIVVRPTTEAQIAAVVSACVDRRLPITLRGAGTGNYGQTTPLAGGVVMDLSNYSALVHCSPGVARAQAGMRLNQLEKHTLPDGFELRCMPSTYRSATLGGLFGGGFGGIGSINYGPLAAPGNVLAIRAMTVEAEPRIVELRGEEALRMHHLWGTNGIVLEIELALAPTHPWSEFLVTFDSFDAGLAFGDVLARAPGIVKREVAFFGSPLPDLLAPLAPYLKPGEHAVIAIVAESGHEAMLQLVERHGGRMAFRQACDEGAKPHVRLAEFTWNHTTLNALKVDPGFTYLQSSFVPGQHVAQVQEMEALLVGEVLMHVEFLRNMDGLITCSGLQLVRYSTEERLSEIMAIHRAHGVRINNPHTYIVEEGKAGGALPEEILAMKRRFDPHALLNPGKLRDYPVTAR